MSENEVPRYSDYAGKRTLEGEQVPIPLGKEITIKDFIVLPSQFEGKTDFLVVQAELKGKLVTFPCGSIAADQLKDYKAKDYPFPFTATIERPKGKKYYVLT